MDQPAPSEVGDTTTPLWIRYSLRRPPGTVESSNGGLFIFGCCILLFVNIGILIHSGSIHGSIPLMYIFRRDARVGKPKSTRVKTEIAAFFYVILVTLQWLASSAFSNSTAWVVLHDLFQMAILGPVVQACDSYMFLDRLKAVSRIGFRKSVLIHLYIWIVLVLSWVLPYSIIPIIYDTNRAEFQDYLYITLAAYCLGVVAYNFYISIEVAWVLWSIRKRVVTNVSESDTSIKTMESIAYRSLAHAMTSSIGSLCYLYVPDPYGLALYGIITPLGMHVWFNAPWWVTTKKSRFLFFDRQVRELVAVRGFMTTVVRRLRIRSVVNRLDNVAAPGSAAATSQHGGPRNVSLHGVLR